MSRKEEHVENDGYKKDAKGRLVPVENIAPVDIVRDELVREIIQKSLSLSKELLDFKKKVLEDIRAFVEMSAERYGAKVGGLKGNVTLTSFDGEYRILLAMDERIAFDEGLHAAKALIDQCIKAWSVGARSELRVLVEDAFSVDKQGKINTGRVLSLRRLDIKDPTWKTAMDAISNSVVVMETREYVRVYRRNERGEYDLVNLDIAA